MKYDFKVKIYADKSGEEYIIKDNNSIVVGRFCISESKTLSKRYDIKLNFYRQNNYELLIDTLTLILKAAFKNNNVFKVNIRISEEISVSAFLNLGFTLEGVFSANEYYNGEYFDELSFGITRTEYIKQNKNSIIELKGRNVTLRNLKPADSEDLLEYYKKNKNYLAPFEPVRDSSFYKLETQRNLLNESYKQLLNGTTIDMGIFKDDKLIGKIKLSNIIYGSLKSGVLGYSLDEDEQGKGYMRESVSIFLKYVFNECNLHRVEASVLVDNIRSRKVLEHMGFKLVGINEKYLLVNGKWQDHATYYIIKDHFNK